MSSAECQPEQTFVDDCDPCVCAFGVTRMTPRWRQQAPAFSTKSFAWTEHWPSGIDKPCPPCHHSENPTARHFCSQNLLLNPSANRLPHGIRTSFCCFTVNPCSPERLPMRKYHSLVCLDFNLEYANSASTLFSERRLSKTKDLNLCPSLPCTYITPQSTKWPFKSSRGIPSR